MAILVLLAVSLFRYVQTVLRTVAIAQEEVNDSLAVERLAAVIQEELYNIPARGQSSLMGKALRLQGRDMDTVEWRSRGGAGLMTSAAAGEYIVRLRCLPVKGQSGKYEIGFEREQVLLDNAGTPVTGTMKPDWLPLVPGASSLRVRYFDSRLGSEQIDAWNDAATRPSYIRVSIAREGDTVPYEAVLTIPSALFQQQQ